MLAKTKTALLSLLACLAGGAAFAAPVTMTFEGVGDQASVNNFYNGGTDSAGNSGANYGVNFSSSTLGLVSNTQGGSGNFSGNPSGDTIIYFNSGNSVMNVVAGFTALSFYYSSQQTGDVLVYDGLNGTGNVLADVSLAANYQSHCASGSTASFCSWDQAVARFTGIAQSVQFGGTAGFVGYDDVALNNAASPAAVPEPVSAALLGTGVFAAGLLRRRRG